MESKALSSPQIELKAIGKLKEVAQSNIPISSCQKKPKFSNGWCAPLLGFETLGRAAKLSYIDTAFAAYLVFKSGILGWIKGNI